MLPLLLIVSFLMLAAGYLQYQWPNIWKGGAPPLIWRGTAFELTQGQGYQDSNALTIRGLNERDIAIAAVVTKTFRAHDYAAVTWNFGRVQPGAELAFLWRTAEDPAHFHSRTLVPDKDGIATLELWNEEHWRGQILGLALAVKGRLDGPIVLNGVSIKPVTFSKISSRIGGQWFSGNGWDARSINFADAGALEHDVPLLVAVTATVLLALALYSLLTIAQLVRPHAMFVSALVFAGWLVLDGRWQWILFDQLLSTARQYSGKTWEQKHLASDDRSLFSFTQKVGAAMPQSSRVLFLSDDAYSRGKGAYYLYPHNVMAAADFSLARACKSGDYVAMFGKKGVKYDAAARSAISEDAVSVAADLVLATDGNLLLRVR